MLNVFKVTVGGVRWVYLCITLHTPGSTTCFTEKRILVEKYQAKWGGDLGRSRGLWHWCPLIKDKSGQRTQQWVKPLWMISGMGLAMLDEMNGCAGGWWSEDANLLCRPFPNVLSGIHVRWRRRTVQKREVFPLEDVFCRWVPQKDLSAASAQSQPLFDAVRLHGKSWSSIVQ